MKAIEKDGGFLWGVFETPSSLLIKIFIFNDDAEKLAKHLNRGGAFSGWTPPFFLIDLSGFIDINEEFSGFFA